MQDHAEWDSERRERLQSFFTREHEGHQRVAFASGRGFGIAHKARFQVIGVDVHLASGDLLVGGVVITQLANAQPLFGAHWRPKDSTGQRTGSIKVAGTGFRIESGARLIIGEIVKLRAGMIVIKQQAGFEISGEFRARSCQVRLCASANACGTPRVELP